jgi:hypothetical protein
MARGSCYILVEKQAVESAAIALSGTGANDSCDARNVVGVFLYWTSSTGRGDEMARFFWICVGGAVGTATRYLLGGWVPTVLGSRFPTERWP